MVPESSSPQVWSPPALTALKRPAGASVWPEPLSPQHSTAPVSRSPQMCLLPALSALKRSAGASVWP